MGPIISVQRARRTFGDVVALDDVDLAVSEGEIVGLLAPTGAGKSTLLSLITGQRRPASGTVRIFGADPRTPAARRWLGTTPQQTGLPATLKVGEVVDFVAGHYANPMSRAEALERFQLTELAGRQTGGLSGGQQRRLAVALSLVGRPRLVLLRAHHRARRRSSASAVAGAAGLPRRWRHHRAHQPLPRGGRGAGRAGRRHRAGPSAGRRRPRHGALDRKSVV